MWGYEESIFYSEIHSVLEYFFNVVFLHPIHYFALSAYVPLALGAGFSIVQAAELLHGVFSNCLDTSGSHLSHPLLMHSLYSMVYIWIKTSLPLKKKNPLMISVI